MFTKVVLCTVGMALFLTIVNAQQPITKECLGCLCEASTGCNNTQPCASAYCGAFLISWAYWADAGKPVLQNDHPGNNNAYVNCVRDLYCAATTVSAYMTKYQQDCDSDGRITCADFARIHKLGPNNCRGAPHPDFWNPYTSCASALRL